MSYKYDSMSTLDQSTSSFLGIQEASASVDITDRIFHAAQKNRNTATHKSFSKPAEFLVYSQELEQEIKKTAGTLRKLNELTSRITRFNKEEAKIENLTTTIKKSISDLQKKITNLQKNNDLKSSKQAEKMAKNICEILNLRVVELIKNFKNALESRTKIIQQFEDKDTSFFTLASQNTTGVRNRKIAAAFLNKGKAYDPEENVSGYNGEHDEEAKSQAQKSHNIEMIRRNQESARGIQKTMEEIVGMFQRISTMAQMHEIMIERIDKDTDDSLRSIQSGRKNLVDAFKNLSGMRRMIVSVFIFLMIFAAVYILII